MLLFIVTTYYCNGLKHEESFEDLGLAVAHYTSLVDQSRRGVDQTPLADKERHLKQVSYMVHRDQGFVHAVRSDPMACIHRDTAS